MKEWKRENCTSCNSDLSGVSGRSQSGGVIFKICPRCGGVNFFDALSEKLVSNDTKMSEKD